MWWVGHIQGSCEGAGARLVHWDQCVREEVIVTRIEHVRGEAAHEGGVLNVKVSQHLVRMPSTNHGDDARVNFSSEECISTRGAEASHGDIRG